MAMPGGLQCLSIAVLLSAMTLSACTARGRPLPERESDPLALKVIRREYVSLVNAALRDRNVRWHTGGIGNILVNTLKGKHRGLCYQWQEYLYVGLLPTVDRVGWQMTGIAVNEGREHEHHCVMVWDPKLVRGEDILTDPNARPVYVLDVWRPRTPNVYDLDEWLRGERPHLTGPRIQPLPESMVPEPTQGRWDKPIPNVMAE